MSRPETEKTAKAVLYCPLCTRYVDGEVRTDVKKPHSVLGQKCPRCSSSLDAAIVVQFPKAA